MLKIGELLDNKYRILSEVGHGGMSTVYLARNERANKNWAVKEIRRNGASRYDVVKQSLLAEVEVMKRLNNPHLPSIVDVIDRDEAFLIVMDFVEGNSLDRELEKGVISEENVLGWGRQLCDVLMYLHNLSPPIIYRDMKPSNVILRPDGVIVLLDFGTAREYRSRRAGDDTTCLGTRGYAAPEQYGGMGETDARTDIYCLGATLYHLATGRDPGLPPYEIRPVRQVKRDLSEGLEMIIRKCTRPDPDERYQSCEELKFDLEHVDEIGRSAQQKRNRRIGLFAGALALFLGGVAGMIAFRAAALKEVRSSYEYCVEQAGGVADLDAKMEYYIQAVRVDPARAEAYNNLLDYFMQDAEITAAESERMTRLLGQLVNGTSARERFRERNREEFEKFAYNFGLYYFLFSESGNEKVGKSQAVSWLTYAAEGSFLTLAEQNTAQTLLVIASAYSRLDNKINSDYSYADYWADLTELNRPEITGQIRYFIVLHIYRYTVMEMLNRIDQFYYTGKVSRDDMQGLLDRISAGTEEIKASNQLDEEDLRLVDAIVAQVQMAGDRLDEYFH
ncbi:MAG: serine/threonine protein kinase [Lachnospiraceae bacterium]|nr:serine/threonine protein kinase [Lachnospiraceae bacterium]